jgi:uncharacterized protein YidB (DUF937 family)
MQEAEMGMLDDILNSIQNAGTPAKPGGSIPVPSGQGQQGQPGQQGMSPIAKVLLALLAMYAVKNVRREPSGQPTGQPAPAPTGGSGNPGGSGLPGGLDELLKGPLGQILGRGAPGAPAGGGGLGDLLGPLGGLLGGSGAGSMLGGGLDNLLKQLKDSGQNRVADSWVNHGPNQPIPEGDLAKALGSDTLDALANHSGLPREQVLSGLSQNLPRFIDQLTPEGRLPTDREWERMI